MLRRPDRAARLSPGDISGVTLVEVMVVMVCMGLVMGVTWQFWSTATRYTRDLQDRFETMSRTHRAVARITREIASCRRLLYPAPGKQAEGLGLVDGDGRPVLYRLDRTVTPPRLLRQTGGEPEQVALEGLVDCQFKTPPVPGGRDPGLVHITALLAGPNDAASPIFLSVRLRPLDVRCAIYR